MTMALRAGEVASKVVEALPVVGITIEKGAVIVSSEFLLEVGQFLKDKPEFAFDYLVSITAVDYLDYFEVVYYLASLRYNHSLVLKTRCYDRDEPAVPSVVSLWQGADLQEREVFDLMGINFSGHPKLKRIFLWEGFPGHPLRRDYL